MNTPRTLDWTSRHDPRSLDYPVSAVIHPQPRRRTYWTAPHARLNQGTEGACVGFAFATEVFAQPFGRVTVPQQTAEEFALGVYREAQGVDEWDGDGYSGTSVLAGAQTIVARGLAEGYRWAFSVEEIIDALCAPASIGGGPVVVGVNWQQGMYQCPKNGLVVPSGPVVGGHALLLTGYHPRRRFGSEQIEVIRWRNSWGPAYGQRGDGWISPRHLEAILKGTGEACVMVGRRNP